MALELLYKPKYIKEHPWSFLILVFVSISISMMLSLLLAEHIASILFICFTTFFLLPVLIQLVTTDEELYALNIEKIQKHYLFRAQMMIFGIGCVTMIAWYLLSPDNIRQLLFSEQLKVLESVAHIPTGNFLSTDSFISIIWNNLQVFHSIFIVSLLFGAGALFLLLWNTSVLAAFVSGKLQTIFASATSTGNIVSQILVFIGSMVFHTILEFSAYIFAGIAGSLLAIAIIKHPWQSPLLNRVLRHTLNVYIIGLVCIVIGALLESLQR